MTVVFPVVMPTYARADVVFERGEGAWLVDTAGRRYLDFHSGVAVTALGHAHPHLLAALTEQAGRLWHCSNLFRIPGQETLATRLTARCFAETAFFANSGAEAWECGAKVIRRYFYHTGQPQRTRIICCTQGFHGRTLAAISATQQEKMITGFAPLLAGFDVVPFGDLAAVEATIGPETAGICVEPVQGEGGIRVVPEGYMAALRRLADQHGLLLYFDEIQTGIGRCGRLFAHELTGVTPDVMCLAKGLGGGFPVGACLATARVAAGMTAGSHGSTFGGNPLAMAVANAVLDVVLAPGFLEQVEKVGQLLGQELAALVARHPTIFPEARGVGLMRGLVCGPSNTDVITAARERGLLLVPAADNVARLLPPLIIGAGEVREAIARLDKTAQALQGGSAAS